MGRLTAGMTLLAVIFLGVLITMFMAQKHVVESTLDNMLTSSLTAHTRQQGNEAGEIIAYARRVLSDTANLIKEEDRRVDGGALDQLLRTVNMGGRLFTVEYVSRDRLAETEPDNGEAVRRALEGEPAVGVMAVEGVERYFPILHPLEENGRIPGVLRVRIRAEQIMRRENHSALFQTVYTMVVGEDGTIVHGYSDAPGSLFDASAQRGISGDQVQALTQAYLGGEEDNCHLMAESGRYFVAWSPIGCNGWRMVQFAQSHDIQKQTGALLDRSLALGVGLVLVTLCFCGVLVSILMRQKRRLDMQKLKYETLAEFNDTLLFEYDRGTDTVEFTANAFDSLELDSLRLEGVLSGACRRQPIHGDDMNLLASILDGRGAAAGERGCAHLRLTCRDGRYHWFNCIYKVIQADGGKRIIGKLNDVSEHIDREDELKRRAERDPLTGVNNRTGIQRIDQLLAQEGRGVLFLLDLDNFKGINDTYGHAAGDEVLVAVARALRESCRSQDVVVRLGGDEFALFLPGTDDEEVARRKGREILDRVSAIRMKGMDRPVTVSVGAAMAPRGGLTFQALSEAADGAMYAVKQSAKGDFALR